MVAPAGRARRRGTAAGRGLPGAAGWAPLASGQRSPGARGQRRARACGAGKPVPAAGLTAPERL